MTINMVPSVCVCKANIFSLRGYILNGMVWYMYLAKVQGTIELNSQN